MSGVLASQVINSGINREILGAPSLLFPTMLFGDDLSLNRSTKSLRFLWIPLVPNIYNAINDFSSVDRPGASNALQRLLIVSRRT